MATFDRRAFLKKVGLATGTAVIAASPVAASTEADPTHTTPSGPMPGEPIVVIVRDAERGEVTVLAGTTERTYRDRVLARRLLKVAQRNADASEGMA